MKLSELINEYDFHDSTITHIDVSELYEKLTISISLCNWRQRFYNESDSEIINSLLTFEGISEFEMDPNNLDFNDDEILEAELIDMKDDGEALKIVAYDGINTKIITISAKEVTLKNI